MFKNRLTNPEPASNLCPTLFPSSPPRPSETKHNQSEHHNSSPPYLSSLNHVQTISPNLSRSKNPAPLFRTGCPFSLWKCDLRYMRSLGESKKSIPSSIISITSSDVSNLSRNGDATPKGRPEGCRMEDVPSRKSWRLAIIGLDIFILRKEYFEG